MSSNDEIQRAARALREQERFQGADEQPVVEFGVRATSPPTGEDLKCRPGA